MIDQDFSYHESLFRLGLRSAEHESFDLDWTFGAGNPLIQIGILVRFVNYLIQIGRLLQSAYCKLLIASTYCESFDLDWNFGVGLWIILRFANLLQSPDLIQMILSTVIKTKQSKRKKDYTNTNPL